MTNAVPHLIIALAGTSAATGCYTYVDTCESCVVPWQDRMDPSPALAGEWVTFQLPDEHLYRHSLSAGALPEDMSPALDQLAPGTDMWAALARDNSWFLMDSSRYAPDCADWPCLSLVGTDLAWGAAIRVDGEVVHPAGFSAVAAGGNLVVYPEIEGTHSVDLFAVHKKNGIWQPPIELTTDSPYAYNAQPALSVDGSTVVFDCGNQPNGDTGTAICEVSTQAGASVSVLWTPEQTPPGASADEVALHHPGYGPNDESVFFESSWFSEQVWQLDRGGQPVAISPSQNNDNSPCVLASGKVLSLWLERPGGTGTHELKVLDSRSKEFQMLLSDVDIVDTGNSCGG